jgi:hypothetical protein
MKFLNVKAVTVWSVSAGVMLPSVGWACACGCGVFDVGGSSMLPSGSGGMAYLQYDYQNQDHNWSGSAQAPAANNGDKDIKTDFTIVGFQYMFNHSWGVSAEIPYDYRTFKTLGGPSGNALTTLKWDALGDLRLHAIYTGFSEDLSSGLEFGLRLPTGNFTHNDPWGDVDRDSEIGSGSTDLLLGGFHRGHVAGNEHWGWFAQGELDLPVGSQDEYDPGWELDSAAGIQYQGWSWGRVHVSPLAQAIFSFRGSDSGANASGGINASDPPATLGQPNSGYQRLLLSPGLEFHIHPATIYADVEVPVWQHFTGNQLAAAVLFKLNVSFHF